MLYERMRQEYSEYAQRFLLTESLKKSAQEELLRLGKEATRLRTRLDKARAVRFKAVFPSKYGVQCALGTVV